VAVVVSRALALYLLCWIFSEITYIPTVPFSLTHYISHPSVLAARDYFSDMDLLSLALRVFRIVTLLGVAFWLYFYGSSTQRYFLAQRRLC
jgi:hypothetical protein